MSEDERQKVLSTLARFRAYVEDACKQEVIARGGPTTAVKKRLSAKVAAAKLFKLLDIPLSEEEAYRLADLEKPEHDVNEPLPGARIDQDRFYHFQGRSVGLMGNRGCCAVRIRPKGRGFEAVTGTEVWGHGMRGVFQRYEWGTLHGVFATAEEADQKLKELYKDQLRKDYPERP
jgi:hypothetical protein